MRIIVVQRDFEVLTGKERIIITAAQLPTDYVRNPDQSE